MTTMVVNSLEQAKLLTDPFKLKLLEHFAGPPRTTKQVADGMGEKAPRLYRHVDALFDAGFLELVDEKPKRGTVERYYQTVASRFEVNPDLFATSQGGEDGDDATAMIRAIFRETESELVKLSALGLDDAPEDFQLPIVMRVALRASPEDIARLREKLEEWMSEVQSLAEIPDDEAAPDDASYAGLLAFYPAPAEISARLADVDDAESESG